ncbi:hypothetical protein ACQUFY_12820 [Robbsia andropogonis]|uniref:hypothetical protein n=1 Tax=Robbsia andropogonis TaxID=28092 RepID=UPI003D221B8D
MRVYPDQSASVRWHDKPPVDIDLGHERITRSLLVLADEPPTIVDVRGICILAMRAAALAPTWQDALDVAGDALLRIARLQAVDSEAKRDFAFCSANLARSEERNAI